MTIDRNKKLNMNPIGEMNLQTISRRREEENT